MNVFQPEKKRRKREGYAEGDYTLYKKVGASEFVNNSEPISVLGTVNQITFTTNEELEYVLPLGRGAEDTK